MLQRRHMLAGLSAALAAGWLPPALGAVPKLGLIFPPLGRGAPEEGLALYGDKVTFLAEGLGLETMTPEGYEAVIDRIPPTAERLVAAGAEAVVLMGTSLSFFKGEAYNQQLTAALRAATGGRLPVTTMSTAVIEGLKAMGASKVAAPTAYNDEVNQRLRHFLGEHGFDVVALRGLGVEAVEDINLVTQPQLLEFCVDVVKSAASADAILVSCGGLRTLEILAPLEDRTGRPAVSSTPHALYAAAKLVGLDPRVAGYGRLIGS